MSNMFIRTIYDLKKHVNFRHNLKIYIFFQCTDSPICIWTHALCKHIKYLRWHATRFEKYSNLFSRFSFRLRLGYVALLLLFRDLTVDNFWAYKLHSTDKSTDWAGDKDRQPPGPRVGIILRLELRSRQRSRSLSLPIRQRKWERGRKTGDRCIGDTQLLSKLLAHRMKTKSCLIKSSPENIKQCYLWFFALRSSFNFGKILQGGASLQKSTSHISRDR